MTIFSSPPEALAHRSPDGGPAHGEPVRLGQYSDAIRQRAVRPLPEERADGLGALGVKFRVTAVLVRRRSDVARRTVAHGEAIDGGDPDAETVGGRLPGALLAEPGRDDVVAQLLREHRGHARIRSRRIAARKTPIKLRKPRCESRGGALAPVSPCHRPPLTVVMVLPQRRRGPRAGRYPHRGVRPTEDVARRASKPPCGS